MMDKKYEDLLEAYRNIDFSAGADKEHTLSHCLRQLENENQTTSKERPYMKKKIKPATGIIAACATLAILTASVYADDAIQWMKKAVIGNTEYSVVLDEPDHLNTESATADIASHGTVSVTVHGKSIGVGLENATGYLGNIKAADYEVSFDSFAEAAGYYAYDYRIPTYLPEGYALDHVSVYDTSDVEYEEVADLLSSLLYSEYRNGVQRITVTMRNAKDSYWGVSVTGTVSDENGNTKIVTDPDIMQEITINGYAAVTLNKTLYIEIDGINYELWGTNVEMDELIKVAESLTE